MLIEEQVSELLQRCEVLLGKELRQIRGDLRNDRTRAAAVWELIVIEATANIGSIEHEPLPGSSPGPDIRLHLPRGRAIWIEATYLYPRFWQLERQSDAVLHWLFSETKRRGISLRKISIRLDGEQKPAGRIRKLPRLDEEKKFLNEPELRNFYTHIASYPNDSYACCLSPYTIFLSYNPNDQSPFLGGLVQEVPIIVQEHAVYRKLKEKARQHNVGEPLVVCIGSDQSPALSRLQSHPSCNDAVNSAFLKYHSLAAVIVVAIELKPVIFEGVKRHVRAEFFLNNNATNPLTLDEVKSLSAMNFNRWKYVSPLPKFESGNTKRICRVTGTLTWRPTPMGLEIEIPANIVVDALAGKTSLTKAYNLTKEHMLSRALNDGWVIKSCRIIEGIIESGEAPKIVLELIPPPVATFWTRKSKVPDDA